MCVILNEAYQKYKQNAIRLCVFLDEPSQNQYKYSGLTSITTKAMRPKGRCRRQCADLCSCAGQVATSAHAGLARRVTYPANAGGDGRLCGSIARDPKGRCRRRCADLCSCAGRATTGAHAGLACRVTYRANAGGDDDLPDLLQNQKYQKYY